MRFRTQFSILTFLIVLSSWLSFGETANILGVFTSNSKSHLIIHMSIVRALVERGHNVTVLTTLPLNDKSPGLRHILLPLSYETEMEQVKKKMVQKSDSFSDMLQTMKIMIGIQKNAIQSKEYLDFLKEGNKFDLLILGYFFNDFQIGIGGHFKCPIVFSWMSHTVTNINLYVGNPKEVSYVPHGFADDAIQPLNFKKRVINFIAFGFDSLLQLFIYYYHESKYNELFPADQYPSYQEMQKNVSLVFCNHHFTEGPIRPNVPALIEIGGIQVKDKPDPLTKELEEFMNLADKEGVIFFSLGSNARSADLREETIQKVFNVLSSLKQKVVWKWEDDKLPGKSKNIYFGKWLPQDDILAHPNTKLFITHGGKGSIIESQFHGIPMLGMPIFGDQKSNVRSIEKQQFGIGIDYSKMTEESLRQTILELLENPKYTTNVKNFAKLYRDRPLNAKETAVFWIEYVIRHNGAPHLQSPLVHMNVFQAHSYDVIAFLLLIIYVICKIIRVSFCFVLSKLWKGKSSKKNENANVSKKSQKNLKSKKSKSE